MPNSVHATQSLSQINLDQALKPFCYLTAAIGDYSRSTRPWIFALIGGSLWLFNLCINYAFDFYESTKGYGYTWATIQTIHLLSYFVYTFYTIQRTIPWLKQGLEQTQTGIMYRGVVNKVVTFTKRLPFLLLFFGLACSSIEYGFLRLDKSAHVNMGMTINSVGTAFLHVLRFISSFHVFLAYGIFWNVPVCVMLLAGYSMKCYIEKMGAQLRSSDLPSFKDSVQTYSERAEFVKKSSSVCMVSLTMLLITSVTRLGLNAYLFLFQQRRYLHIWHALLPLALMVYPLCTAAWITKQYHWFIIVVVRAWVERGEDSDDEEDDIEEITQEPIQDTSPAESRKSGKSNIDPAPGSSNTGLVPQRQDDWNAARSFDNTSSSKQNQDVNKNFQLSAVLASDNKKGETHAKLSENMELSSLVSAIKAINKMKKATRRKFNFDKFLSYLESMRPVVGFSIGGIIVTWDLVSTILFLIFSIVAVLVQESIFGSQKSTIT